MSRALPPRALAVALTIGLAGCGGAGDGDGSPEPRAPFVRATTLLEAGRYEAASVALREVASRCESGDRGRHALLLLAALDLDPRNEAAEPDSAALMAARYLSLPDLPVEEKPLGRTLYVLALDRGGDPGLRPSPTPDPAGLAARFANCDEPAPERVVSLPVLPDGPQESSLLELADERDSAVGRAAALSAENEALRARVAELEAELERIRRILQARPDTTDTLPPRDLP